MPRPQTRARLGQADDHLVTVEVEGPRGRGVLEYRSPEPLWRAAPPTLDFAAVALVQYAASSGTDLVVEGPVSREQLEHLDEYLQIWHNWRPDLYEHVEIRAEQEVDVAVPEGRGGAVMGFSGGVDAGFALAAHSTGALGRLSREVDLGILVVGWDLRHGDDEARELAIGKAKRALDAYDVDMGVVSTNWQQDFCDAWFMSFNSGLMSILHTFAATHSAAIHATDRSYRDELESKPYGSHLMINHLLGHHGFPVVSTGGSHTRAERVAFLADHPALTRELRVCHKPHAGGGNCGHCEKCIRTQLELRAAGISTETAFPSPMTLEEVRTLVLKRKRPLMHYESILALMSPEDEYRPVLERWVRRQKHRPKPQVRALRRRVTELEGELEAMRSSRSWRVTEPLRALRRR